MTFEVRRIVTGHDDRGLAIIKQDEVLVSEPRRPGYDALVAWCTSELPVNNNEEAYRGGEPGTKGNRALFRIGEMIPGDHSPVMHRTETCDYAIVISGELELHLDGGEVETLKPGDVVIQRGTNHAWKAVGTVPVKVMFILIDAEPTFVNGTLLGNHLENFEGGITPMPGN